MLTTAKRYCIVSLIGGNTGIGNLITLGVVSAEVMFLEISISESMKEKASILLNVNLAGALLLSPQKWEHYIGRFATVIKF